MIRPVTFHFWAHSPNHYNIQITSSSWFWPRNPKTGTLLLHNPSFLQLSFSKGSYLIKTTEELFTNISKLVVCCWRKFGKRIVKLFYIHFWSQSKQWIFIEWLRRQICFFSALSDKSCLPADVGWLTVHCQLSISWWPDTLDSYGRMDNTYKSKQNGGHSNLSRLLLLLLLAGNTRIFLLTKISVGESNFTCDNLVLWHSVQ